jgi:6-phosphogluconolactonase
VTPDVRVYRDLEALSQAAATAFSQAVTDALQERERALIAISGGTTPSRLYELLARSPYREQIDWPRTHLFWADERLVPVEDLENNFKQAHEIWLKPVGLPAANLHRVRTELGGEAAREDYARLLRAFATPPLTWPRFDLVLLGMGEDGHTASLFPGSPIETAQPVLRVSAHYGNRPNDRITLSEAVLNSARLIFFLVSGAGKSRILADVLYGERRPEALPAQRIQPKEGSVVWMVDRSAATSQ